MKNTPFPFVITEPTHAAECLLSQSQRMILGCSPWLSDKWDITVYQNRMNHNGSVRTVAENHVGDKPTPMEFDLTDNEAVEPAEWLRNITVDDRFGVITFPLHLSITNMDLDGDVFAIKVEFDNNTVSFHLWFSGVWQGTIAHPFRSDRGSIDALRRLS